MTAKIKGLSLGKEVKVKLKPTPEKEANFLNRRLIDLIREAVEAGYVMRIVYRPIKKKKDD